jgi:DNA-binding transcriptional regulator GbsR (MarR family)
MDKESATPAQAAREHVIDWLGEIGPRWGLPAEACRVHGYLYLSARPVPTTELSGALNLSADRVEQALQWLRAAALAAQSSPALWHTDADPWVLLRRGLETRREAELGPALEVLRAGRRDAAGDPTLAGQIAKLLGLVEDIAAVSAQAQRLPPVMLRGLLNAGGQVARLVGGAHRRR